MADPTMTLTRVSAGPALMAWTRSGPEAPTRTPSTTTASPARAVASSFGRSSGVSRSAVTEPPITRCWESTTWTTCAPDTGTGLGSRFSLTIAATSWALASASLSSVRLTE